jgi:hypothetical protein
LHNEVLGHHTRDTPDFTVFKALEALTKGMEVDLPPGTSFRDADGKERTRIRVQWWRSGAVTYLDAAEAPPSIRTKGGKLVAYRWEGEPALVNEHFVSL